MMAAPADPPSTSVPTQDRPRDGTRRLRSACDNCHLAKIRCTGAGSPCPRCIKDDIPCRYSYTAKLGKPKGSRNKKTLEKLSRIAAPSPSQMNTPSSTTNLSHTGSIADSVPSLDHIASTPQSGSQFGDGYDFPLPSDLFGSMLELDLPVDIQSWNSSPVVTAPEQIHSNPGPHQMQKPSWHRDFAVDTISRQGSRPGSQKGNPNHIESHQHKRVPSTPYHNPGVAECSNPRSPLSLGEGGMSCSTPGFNNTPAPPSLPSPDELWGPSCTCLTRLTDQLCHLNTVERKQARVSVDIMIWQARLVLKCCEEILDCDNCRLDSKVLLMCMTVLQTIFNWASVQCHPDKEQCPAVSTYFGRFSLSEDESNIVKLLLISRVLARSKSTIKALCARVEQMIVANRQQLQTRFMDVDSLQHSTRRLVQSYSTLSQHFQSYVLQQQQAF